MNVADWLKAEPLVLPRLAKIAIDGEHLERNDKVDSVKLAAAVLVISVRWHWQQANTVALDMSLH